MTLCNVIIFETRQKQIRAILLGEALEVAEVA